MKRKALFIGGTGTISAAITARVAADPAWDLYLLNRGRRTDAIPDGVRLIQCDIRDEAETSRLLGDLRWDCVCDFIGFVRADAERDWRLFRGKTGQYMYVSSASAYQKPPVSPFITESTPLANPYWQYSRDKIACEDFLMEKYRTEAFPVTIIRPSHTYDDRKVPLAVHGSHGTWQVLRRMLDGKPVIIQGDGTTQWTLTHNSDFAKGFTGLMGNPLALGNAFQITSDETLTWLQIYRIIADALGVELKACHVATDFLVEAGRTAGRQGLERPLRQHQAQARRAGFPGLGPLRPGCPPHHRPYPGPPGAAVCRPGIRCLVRPGHRGPGAGESRLAGTHLIKMFIFVFRQA